MGFYNFGFFFLNVFFVKGWYLVYYICFVYLLFIYVIIGNVNVNIFFCVLMMLVNIIIYYVYFCFKNYDYLFFI